MRSMARQRERRRNIRKLRNKCCISKRSLIHLCFGQISTALVGYCRYSLVMIDPAGLIIAGYG